MPINRSITKSEALVQKTFSHRVAHQKQLIYIIMCLQGRTFGSFGLKIERPGLASQLFPRSVDPDVAGAHLLSLGQVQITVEDRLVRLGWHGAGKHGVQGKMGRRRLKKTAKNWRAIQLSALASTVEQKRAGFLLSFLEDTSRPVNACSETAKKKTRHEITKLKFSSFCECAIIVDRNERKTSASVSFLSMPAVRVGVCVKQLFQRVRIKPITE